MGWYERWAQWSERYRFVFDLVLTVVAWLFVMVLSASGSYGLSGTESALLAAAVLAPLPWCRTRPVASCVAMFVVCMLQVTALGLPVFLPADLAVLVSMYCVTVYGPRWAYLMACGMTMIGAVTVGVGMWARYPGDSLASTIPAIILIMALLACSFAFGLLRRSRRAMLVAMRDRADRLEIERDQQAQIATAAERARIAREMHDIVAHSLSVVIAQADGGRYAAAADPAAAERSLNTIAETGRAALADMRRLLGVLREGPGRVTTPLGLVAPDDTPARRRTPAAGPVTRAESRASSAAPGSPPSGGAGLGDDPVAAAPSSGSAAPLRPQPDATDIGDLVSQARDDGLKVSWARVGVERRLPPGVGLTLFRVCQEALTNVRKHAGPRPAVTVLLRWGEDQVELRVDDDGRGLAADGSPDPAEPSPSAGYGLLGMRERAEMFGGTLTAGPRRGGGYSVRFVVPIPRSSDVVPSLPQDEPDAGQPDAAPAPPEDRASRAAQAQADLDNTQGAR
ncbi:sensor histidine kinase [Promicromonospora sp. Populi]|uniref:sensor histidine kinase n=1 Tax=Promicromonospora sp. Populi TaxID=3239420 RepID=UPI0034E2DC8A